MSKKITVWVYRTGKIIGERVSLAHRSIVDYPEVQLAYDLYELLAASPLDPHEAQQVRPVLAPSAS